MNTKYSDERPDLVKIAAFATLIICAAVILGLFWLDPYRLDPDEDNPAAYHHQAAQLGPALALTSPLLKALSFALPTQSELRHFYRYRKGQCGAPTSAETMKNGVLKMRFQRCTIHARFTLTTKPAPVPTPAPPPPQPKPTIIYTPVPTAVPPTSTPTVAPKSVPEAFLDEINTDRSLHGAAALTSDPTLVNGTSSCKGAQAHAVAMSDSSAKDRQVEIWHTDPRYPASSFPQDICEGAFAMGQNVGVAFGDEMSALNQLQAGMLNEQWTPGCGPTGTYDDHACNLRSPAFHKIGLGIYQGYQGAWYLVESFTG